MAPAVGAFLSRAEGAPDGGCLLEGGLFQVIATAIGIDTTNRKYTILQIMLSIVKVQPVI